MHRHIQRFRAGKERAGDQGFTLIELLVVITILGILAAITVFSVAGTGDKGLVASAKTDATILRTAEEAYCAKNGAYGDATALKNGGFIASIPTYSQVAIATTGGPCNGYSFLLSSGQWGPQVNPAAPAAPTAGTTFGPSTAARVLTASNAKFPFLFLGQTFAEGHGPGVQFTNGGSSGTLSQIATDRPGQTPAASGLDALFASADEFNVNNVIPVAQGGSCNGTTVPWTGAVNCTGIGSTKAQYAVGRLASFACKSGALNPVGVSCGAPSGGFLGAGNPVALPTSMSGIVSALRSSFGGGATGTCTSFKLATANPGNVVGTTGPPVAPVTAPLTPATAPTAPYGYAAWEALIAPTGVGGGGMDSTTTNWQGTGMDEYHAMVRDGCIVFGSNLTNTENLVRTTTTAAAVNYDGSANGTHKAHMALLSKSAVTSPVGDDANNWLTVSKTSHSQIKQFAVVLNHGNAAQQAMAQAFLDYVRSSTGQSVMASFGYDPIT